MSQDLQVAFGQFSSKGRKLLNQDFHGCMQPQGQQQQLKGIAFAVADGISSSDVSHIASENAVTGLLQDYYCTSESWTVRKSAEQVLAAINGWLYAQTLQSPFSHDFNRGYVCTLSALILRHHTAHLFHLGDSRIYRLRNGQAEQLTIDHRIVESASQSYLANAMGMKPVAEIDYQAQPLQAGDIYLLATDGVYEYVSGERIWQTIQQHPDNLDEAARLITETALAHGSADNLTIQIVMVQQLPDDAGSSPVAEWKQLPLPPELDARMEFDGYRILRNLHISSRSHVWLAEDIASGQQLALKVPSGELQGDPDYLDRFLMEEWIARRITSAHVLQPLSNTRPRNFLYTTMEYVEGQTLEQWLRDNPKPSLETVRTIIEQVARGLRAFHRMEMLHQDLKPENILIDTAGTVKIIDFGSTRVYGLNEIGLQQDESLPGTALYMAPEYFLGYGGSILSDQFSLAVLSYYMLTGQYPYGTKVARCHSAAAQRKLKYRSILQDEETEIPAWVDAAIQRACAVDPLQRYDDLFEFVHDLRHPNEEFLRRSRPPLAERNPVAFWQGIAAAEAVLVLLLVYLLLG
ncbi:bifunctional protein-serine/threonine kinase/phosphatase [Oceanobacter mangrovi]|uniref:bifunctional protein-serine/threonine kinase/phosphatase n=1 Tax=Oceanobacter mangrovi TaxID=2862510 RepID=UPI001C8D6DD0|nr:bifunctional protein-serine/threonine kinase/phosphatase [Oceanobacter mangrovi]